MEDNRVVRTVPTKGYPVNDGFCCIKGLSLDKQQQTVKPNSLPKIRQQDGTFKEVSWEEGFQYVADKLKELQAKYGQESVAGISTGQLTMEEFAIFGHVMRNYLKANVDGNTRLCMATAVVAHPILWGRVRQNQVPDHKIIVIDPRKSETAMNADYWYGLKWRSDLLLLYTVANQLIEKDYLDHSFIEEHTEKFQEFSEFVKDYTLEKGAEGTGLSEEQITELVELIHSGKRVSFWWTMGVNQGYEAVRTAQAIINLALMTGNIGKPGTGANSITGQCNAMGSRSYSNTAAFFGGGDFANPARRKRIAQAAKKLDLFVVQDIYDTIESAEDCTVFFPVVPGLKKEGTYINMERRLSAMRQVLQRGENEIFYTCMTGAMKKNPETGYVEYDKEQCASCYMCIMSCPYGILKYDSIHQKEIMKCNMCVHRSEDGSANPMCVEKCPMQAITLEEVQEK